MKILVVTDDPDFDSVLPVALLSPAPRSAPMTPGPPPDVGTADAAIIDARNNLVGARATCRKMAETSPTVALLAVMGEGDLVAADTDWGIDDVVLPGAAPAELHARLGLAIKRRSDQRTTPARVQLGDLVLDEASYTAFAGRRRLDLTLTEFKLLDYLARHPGHAFTREQLLRDVWGHGRYCKTVDVHVQRLRAKLGRSYQSLVDTVRGVGYMAACPSQNRSAVNGRPRGVAV